MKLLFIHPLKGNAFEIFKALQRYKNLEVFSLKEKKNQLTLMDRIQFRLKLPSDLNHYNQQLREYPLDNINIIFVVKGNELYPWILKEIKQKFPHIKFINWSQDDMYAFHNRSFFYKYNLKYYDLVVTQKSYNVLELQKLGAKQVLFQNKAYSKDIHTPKQCSGKYNHDIVFIGFPENERIKSILFLANNGIKVDIYGYPDVWRKNQFSINHKNITIHDQSLYGEEYAEALSCAKISLCFLRKINRDLQTSRSIEIPACKGFMLAERTDEHLKLFEEDKEAVYFSDNDELLKKVQYYLKNAKERENIRENGYKRCISSEYSYDDRVEEIIEEVDRL